MLWKWILIEACDLQYIDQGHELDTGYGGNLCHMQIKLSCSMSKFSQQIFHLTVTDLQHPLAMVHTYVLFYQIEPKNDVEVMPWKQIFPFDLYLSSDLWHTDLGYFWETSSCSNTHLWRAKSYENRAIDVEVIIQNELMSTVQCHWWRYNDGQIYACLFVCLTNS